MSVLRFAVSCVLVVLLAGCATDASVTRRVDYCCGPSGAHFATYSLTLESMPAFLVAPMREELAAALAAKGMYETKADPDALVTLRYSAVYPTQPFAKDGFADPLTTTRAGPRRFEADVTLEIRRASDGADVLRGTLSREHTESVGTYDHHRARSEIRDGFDHLLRRLPKQ